MNKIENNEEDSFLYKEKRDYSVVYRLPCRHFVQSIGTPYECPICNKKYYEREVEKKKIDTCNSYKCWDEDCNFWIADIKFNRINEFSLRCPNCGNLTKISNKKRKLPNGWSRLRHECFKRDNYKCVECGATNKEKTLHADHILPTSQGGQDELSNLQTLCEDCNVAKSDKNWKGGKRRK